jgi:hypothetical protein
METETGKVSELEDPNNQDENSRSDFTGVQAGYKRKWFRCRCCCSAFSALGLGAFRVVVLQAQPGTKGFVNRPGFPMADGWSQSELAKRAELSLPTVKRVEAGMGPRVSDEARARIQKALEMGGAQFISENGGGPGVRLIPTLRLADRRLPSRGVRWT